MVAGDFLNTVIPYVLIAVGIIWVWSVFNVHIKNLYEWLKSFSNTNKDRFQKTFNPVKEFSYS